MYLYRLMSDIICARTGQNLVYRYKCIALLEELLVILCLFLFLNAKKRTENLSKPTCLTSFLFSHSIFLYFVRSGSAGQPDWIYLF